ncbi:phosphoribosyltransferase family protein [Chitinophaga sp.]|uniref:phosphoribosyltransferase n=1 Tax=Chitinophaga sp. TaxID=1869181 RepID=UPI0031E11371
MFHNRKQAAVKLAKSLEKYKKEHPVVIGIPRGGLETAYYVARHLHAELAFILVKKLSAVDNPEYAIGAVTEDGTVYYNPGTKEKFSREYIDAIEQQKRKEIEKRRKLYRNIQLFPKLKNKTVIIVDDGIATGATILAVVAVCKKGNAEKIIVASPVCPHDVTKQLSHEVDDIVMLKDPDEFSAVSDFYENFQNIDDEEALDFLKRDS